MSVDIAITQEMRENEEKRAIAWLQKAKSAAYNEFFEGATPGFCNDSERTPETIKAFEPGEKRRAIFDAVCGRAERAER